MTLLILCYTAAALMRVAQADSHILKIVFEASSGNGSIFRTTLQVHEKALPVTTALLEAELYAPLTINPQIPLALAASPSPYANLTNH